MSHETFLKTGKWGKHQDCLHFTGGDNKTERGTETDLKSHSKKAAELRLDARLVGDQAQCVVLWNPLGGAGQMAGPRNLYQSALTILLQCLMQQTLGPSLLSLKLLFPQMSQISSVERAWSHRQWAFGPGLCRPWAFAPAVLPVYKEGPWVSSTLLEVPADTRLGASIPGYSSGWQSHGTSMFGSSLGLCFSSLFEVWQGWSSLCRPS